MELGKIIYDYAKIMERESKMKNTCYIRIVLNKTLKYTIYIIPKKETLIIQYNKLALEIKRDKDDLKDIINYFHDMITHDYISYYTLQLNTFPRSDVVTTNERSLLLYSRIVENGMSYDFTLNIGDKIVYQYIENYEDPLSYTGILSFNMNEIITPLIYLTNTIID